MMNLPIPDFRSLDVRVDDRLNEILHRALARDLTQRYQSGDELLYDLEPLHLSLRLRPDNETLGSSFASYLTTQFPGRLARHRQHQHFKRTSRSAATAESAAAGLR